MVVSNRKQCNRRFYFFFISLAINCRSPLSAVSSLCDCFFHHDSSNRAKAVSTNKNGTMERQQDKPTGTFCTLDGQLVASQSLTTETKVVKLHPFRALVSKPEQHDRHSSSTSPMEFKQTRMHFVRAPSNPNVWRAQPGCRRLSSSSV